MDYTAISNSKQVFITGGTGYLGQRLIPRLLERGCHVRALVRESSLTKLPAGCEAIIGDALDNQTYRDKIQPAQTFVHLVGVSNPNPSKADLFREIDLTSVQQAVEAAAPANVRHFVYVSVAQPAPVMKAYVQVRAECEQIIRASSIPATILRPWYILGPGHRWPYLILPIYKILELVPATAETARRMGLVRLPQMIAALTAAVMQPSENLRLWEVPKIREF
jgi:uncharacterized protein YbjT (DUF2867 family)